MKLTLRRHTSVNRSVQCGTAATSTNPGLIVPVLVGPCAKNSDQSFPTHYALDMLTKNPMFEQMVRAPLRPHPPTRYNYTSVVAINEVINGMK